MKKSKFSEPRIVAILKEGEAGVPGTGSARALTAYAAASGSPC